jgi:hypothetical protein
MPNGLDHESRLFSCLPSRLFSCPYAGGYANFLDKVLEDNEDSFLYIGQYDAQTFQCTSWKRQILKQGQINANLVVFTDIYTLHHPTVKHIEIKRIQNTWITSSPLMILVFVVVVSAICIAPATVVVVAAVVLPTDATNPNRTTLKLCKNGMSHKIHKGTVNHMPVFCNG